MEDEKRVIFTKGGQGAFFSENCSEEEIFESRIV